MTIISVEQVAGRDRPKVRLSPGLLQPRLVSRRAGGHAHVALVAGGAVLLGGDTVSIEVRVGTGCTLVVEDVGGTVAYPAGPARAALTGEGVSTWDVDIEVADGGRLIWETYPFVVATGARVRRSTPSSDRHRVHGLPAGDDRARANRGDRRRDDEQHRCP